MYVQILYKLSVLSVQAKCNEYTWNIAEWGILKAALLNNKKPVPKMNIFFH